MWATKFSHGINLAYCAGLALLVSACGGGSHMPSVGSTDPGPGACPAGIGGMPTGCCDSTGAVLSPSPSGVTGCVNLNLGSAPVAGTGTKGAGNAGGSVGDIATAQTLVGHEVATGMGGQYSAATAGVQKPGSQLSNMFANAANPGSGALNPTAGSAGGGGPSGSGTGLGLDTSSVSTAPAPNASSSPSVSGATAADASAYSAGSGGAGGGVLPNGARASGFQFGNGLTGGDGSSGKDVAFGDGNGTDPMADGDPADYFTRIGIEDSLFKKVERRYRDKSMRWASADATSPSRSMASVPNVSPNGGAK